MENRIARIISIVMHPMFTGTIAMLIMLNLNTYFVMILPEKLRWSIIVMVFGNTALLPAILIWMMVRRNLISSFEMPLRRERRYPYLIFAIFYASTYFLLKNLGLPPLYYLFIAGGLASILAATMINLYWKISIHMIGIGALTGGFIALSYKSLMNEPWLLLLLIFLSGLTGFARLQSNAHTPAQIYAGYLTGAGLVGGLFFLI